MVRAGRNRGRRPFTPNGAAHAGVGTESHTTTLSPGAAPRLSDKVPNPTMKFLAALLCAACLGAQAQAGDPLKSTACGEALAALQAARGSPALQPLRQRAAQACLGSTNEARRAPRTLRPPIAVPPPVIVPPAQPPALLAAPVPPPPPVVVGRPPRLTHCDAGGCWADDGTGLRQVGPGLAGPAGLCTLQGGLVYCP